MKYAPSFADFPNDELLAEVKRLAACERQATVLLIASLMEAPDTAQNAEHKRPDVGDERPPRHRRIVGDPQVDGEEQCCEQQADQLKHESGAKQVLPIAGPATTTHRGARRVGLPPF